VTASARAEPPRTAPFLRLLVIRWSWGRRLEKVVLRRTGYSVVSAQVALFRRTRYAPTLLLTTIGRRTGELREVALPYHRSDGEYIVFGSAAGGPRSPEWTFNLKADGRCWICVQRKHMPGMARILEGLERQSVLERSVSERPIVRQYEDGERSHGREMPIIAIRPTLADPTTR
jgi:deazaflavin-dependent oxidoreductase (nitroreductase family)